VTGRLIAGGVLLAGVATCGFLSTMVDEVNSRLAESERFDPYVWYPGKFSRPWSEYRRSQPGRTLARQFLVVSLAGGACLVAAACLLFSS
jgi:hypothetical protein